MPRSLRALPAVLPGILLAIFGSGAAFAGEKCKMSWVSAVAESKYTQQHAMDVGDVPGHQVRVYELHRTYKNDKPNCEGLRRIETWVHGFSDYIDRNGHTWGYEVTTLDNGDKIYGDFSGTSRLSVAANGSKSNTTEIIATWTGGTGKYLGVRGIEWDHVTFDIDKASNERQADAEYWFEK